MACMAKKTVYFEVKERQVTNENPAASSTASGGEISGGDNTGTGASVTAFDGPAVNSKGAGTTTIVREIVPVEIVPVNLPVQYTVSPARIVSPKPGG